jgi:hypothetical protein
VSTPRRPQQRGCVHIDPAVERRRIVQKKRRTTDRAHGVVVNGTNANLLRHASKGGAA